MALPFQSVSKVGSGRACEYNATALDTQVKTTLGVVIIASRAAYVREPAGARLPPLGKGSLTSSALSKSLRRKVKEVNHWTFPLDP
jgi:hypothetical protein